MNLSQKSKQIFFDNTQCTCIKLYSWIERKSNNLCNINFKVTVLSLSNFSKIFYMNAQQYKFSWIIHLSGIVPVPFVFACIEYESLDVFLSARQQWNIVCWKFKLIHSYCNRLIRSCDNGWWVGLVYCIEWKPIWLWII